MNDAAVIIVLATLIIVLLIIALLVSRRRSLPRSGLTEEEIAILDQQQIENFDLIAPQQRGVISLAFKGHDKIKDRRVTLSFLKSAYSGIPSIADDFKHNAEILNHLIAKNNSSFVVADNRVNETRVSGELRLYMASSYVPGVSLAKLLKHKEKLAPRDAYTIIRQLAEVAAAAHKERLWLHALPPQSILVFIDDKGELRSIIRETVSPYHKLASVHSEEAGAELRKIKDCYAPEEQAENVSDIRSDVYALAALLRTLLGGDTSHEHFGRSFMEAQASALSAEASRRPSTPEEFMASLCELESVQSSVAPTSAEDIRLLMDEDTAYAAGVPASSSPGKDRNKRRWNSSSIRKTGILKRIKIALLSFFTVWLGAKIIGFFNKPGKVILAIFLVSMVAALSIWWFWINPVRGLLVIDVREFSQEVPPPQIDSVEVEVEALDGKGIRIPSLFFKNSNGQSDDEGLTRRVSNIDGIVAIPYQARFDLRNVFIKTTVNPGFSKHGKRYTTMELQSEPLMQNKALQIITAYLRPVYGGTIDIRIPRPRLSAWLAAPETFAVEVYATDNNDIPTPNLHFGIEQGDSVKYLKAGTAGTYTGVLNAPYTAAAMISYEVPDSTRLHVSVLPDPSLTDLRTAPSIQSYQVVADKDRLVFASSVERRRGSQRIQYMISVVDAALNPVPNLSVFVNDRQIGTTNSDGGIPAFPPGPIADLQSFWEESWYVAIKYPGHKFEKSNKIALRNPGEDIVDIKIEIDKIFNKIKQKL